MNFNFIRNFLLLEFEFEFISFWKNEFEFNLLVKKGNSVTLLLGSLYFRSEQNQSILAPLFSMPDEASAAILVSTSQKIVKLLITLFLVFPYP